MSHSTQPADVALRKATRRLLPFLFCLYVTNYLDRVNVGFAALQMKPMLHFSDAVYGIGGGIFFVGYLLFQLPSNLILVRIGARRWLGALMIAWGLVSACTLLVHSAETFYFFRFLLGATEAGFFPGVILYLTHWFPASARARSVALFMMAAPISGIIGSPISGALLSIHPGSGLVGWQWLFLVEGLPAVALGICVPFFLTEKPHHAKWLTDEERNGLLDSLAREAEAAESTGSASVTSIIAKPEAWILAAAYFTLTFASYALNLWLPQLVKLYSGYEDWLVGFLMVAPFAVSVCVMGFVANRADKTHTPHAHYAGVCIAAALALLFSLPARGALLPTILLSITVAGIYSGFGPFWAMPRDLLAGAAAPAAIAFINSLGNLGGAFGPSVVGIIKQHTGGFDAGKAVVAATLFLGALLAKRARPHRVGVVS
jgi:MFS transporter, ACS family, tartrate transporter